MAVDAEVEREEEVVAIEEGVKKRREGVREWVAKWVAKRLCHCGAGRLCPAQPK